MPRRPNVVVVLADEWPAHLTGHAGDPNVATPCVDALARSAVEVGAAVSGQPVCCPYRAGLITGQYPLTHGVVINDVELPPQSPSIARDFAAAGYDTAWIGKWHLHGSPDGRNGRRTAPVPASHRMGFRHWMAAECSHDYNRSHFHAGDDPTPRTWDGYDAEAQTAAACDWLADAARRRDPFLLCLSWGPPHFPLYSAPERYRARFPAAGIRLRPNVPAAFADLARRELAGAAAHIAALDDCLGRLLAAIAASGAAEDTIVLFTSDHGNQHHSHGLNFKLFPFDESVRVPFLLRWPAGLGAGQRIDLPIDAPDLLPTLAGLCGIARDPRCQGRDWSPELRGERPADPEDAALLLGPVPITAMRWYGFPAFRGLRDARHTYVATRDGPFLLYDHRRDPYQMRNLIADPASAGFRDALNARLRRRLAALGDPFAAPEVILAERGLEHYREAQERTWRTWQDPWAPAAAPLPADAWTFIAP